MGSLKSVVTQATPVKLCENKTKSHEYGKKVCKERGTSTAGRETGEDQGNITGAHYHHEWKCQRTEFITKTTTKKKN